MEITILAWGSLIWDPRDLPINGDWQRGGPALPIEFSRISCDGRLTLVIDERHGADVPTRYARSSRSTLSEAVTDLQQREGCLRENIGFFEVATKSRAAERHPAACKRIKTWAEEKGFDAVVWTALPSNFAEVAKRPFSVEAAINHLQTLTGRAKSRALEYLQKAPPEVVTPVRTAAIQAGLIPAVQPVCDDKTRPKPATDTKPQ